MLCNPVCNILLWVLAVLLIILRTVRMVCPIPCMLLSYVLYGIVLSILLRDI